MTTTTDYEHTLNEGQMQTLLNHGSTVIEFGDETPLLRDGFSDKNNSENEA